MPVRSVLFICLGNICRSPLAQAALEREAAAAGVSLLVDSAGTGGWHAGKAPDRRAIAQARREGLSIEHYRARQVQPADFRRFDLVVALDADNLADLRRLRPADGTARLSMLLDHVPDMAGQDVADPYYGDEAAFAQTWREVELAARHLLREIAATP